ncbi:MAG TPA: GNAT family N-acetyltransferase [Thermohalobaculum sp.]|nr:GNAT family N-acetyltransferase [Thermohalobaculum sp.]
MTAQRTAGSDAGQHVARRLDRRISCRARIRRAEERDAPAIAEMANALALLTTGKPGQMTADLARHDLIGDRRLGCLVADRDGEAIGYALWSAAYETAFATRGIYVSDLYVRPAQRRGGVGHALMRALARVCRAEGGRYIWWAVSPENPTAQRFYDSLGAISDPVDARAVIDVHFQALLEDQV